MSHTPGPWEVRKNAYVLDVIGADGYCVAEFDDPKDHANACLTAAGPELLAALRASLRFLGSDLSGATAVSMVALQARRAIAKATGE
jgi:hypothetical protein